MTIKQLIALVASFTLRECRLMRKGFGGLLPAVLSLFFTSAVLAANFEYMGVESVFRNLPEASKVQSHAIMIASGRRPFGSLRDKDLAEIQDYFVYQTKVKIDGTLYYRLAVGNFADAIVAKNDLQQLQLSFPDAWIYERGKLEIDSLKQFDGKVPPDLVGDSGSRVVRKPVLSALGCMLEPSKKVEVSSPVSGVLDQVHVKRGDRVIAGNTLFELQAGVEKAGVQLARVKSEFAQRKAERNVELYTDDLLSAHERDEIETELLLAEMELLQKEQELALRTIYSPIDGVVVDRLRDKGEYVNVDPVLRLATLNPLHVDLLLPSEYFGKIAVGQNLLISAEPALTRARKASVTTVDPLIDPASGTFRVQLEMSNPNNRIPAGLRCNARRTR